MSASIGYIGNMDEDGFFSIELFLSRSKIIHWL